LSRRILMQVREARASLFSMARMLTDNTWR
jgi:hypothetical protein